MLSYIIPFLILILVVVFIHEYGHYYFARKYGVGVTDFSIGFGKRLFNGSKSFITFFLKFQFLEALSLILVFLQLGHIN